MPHIILFLLFFLGSPGEEERFPESYFNTRENVFVVGEELTYNVRYGFISLGKIQIRLEDTEEKNGKSYIAVADIESYPGVPFVTLKHIYSSYINPNLYSTYFESLELKKDVWGVVKYDFDYENNMVIVREGERGESDVINSIDTLKIDNFYQDGLSLFFFARGYSGGNGAKTAPVFIDRTIATTDFEFSGEGRPLKTREIDYKVNVTELRGRANFKGIFGLTGAFRGWFSNDEAAIPIEAKLRVLMGNVTVELVEWNRSDWEPPHYEEP